jgi:hypothetical protein
MTTASRVALCFPLAAMLGVAPSVRGQHKPLARQFAERAEEHYQLALGIKAESHSVAIETVAAQTYVTPLAHSAEVVLRWRAKRQVLAVQPDGTAEIEEALTPTGPQCVATPQAPEETELALQTSLNEFCNRFMKSAALHYFESRRGLLRQETPAAVPPLGESTPPLLALWLLRAVRPSVIFPALTFEVGAKSQRSSQPAVAALQNARGSETTEWLDAPGEVPAATLHVVQQLSWNSSPPPQTPPSPIGASSPQPIETFFADSLTTLSLLDGSVLHASRTASRTTSLPVNAVPGLPQPPDFSSKVTLSITIERLP